MNDTPKNHFENAAAAPVPRLAVTVEIDADVLAWMKSEGINATEEINGFLRFHMDLGEAAKLDAQPEAWEPGEMAALAPAPAR
ncbi:hypothetical protein [Methylobacterium sp. GC_Met_2]|uniref:hypothetical protein n=1 Tax=Methylobacterium sp. GC_Met_2 TaxID=2937376 RepID=UPI00226B2BBB|nr:hypothetical protein [Methylobacterium sp. GC_Met_2]